jgi:hypothetical protein
MNGTGPEEASGGYRSLILKSPFWVQGSIELPIGVLILT